MGQSINLIPKTEKVEQNKAQIVKASSVISMVVFFGVALFSAYTFYKTITLKSQIKNFDTEITDYRKKVKALDYIEISARNLDARYRTLKSIFGQRRYYSVLLEEFEKRVPSNVVVDNFNLAQNDTINLSGSGSDYMAVASFIRNLSDSNFVNAKEGLGPLFYNVTLNTVSLETQSNKALFFIVVSYKADLLKGK